MNQTINIENALKVEGWMNPAELGWLADQASRHGLIVEVGSYFGRSCRAIADNTPGRVIAVDTWIGPLSLNDPNTIPSFEQKFRQNLADLILQGKVYPITPSSELLENLHPDMVFIDGDHHFEVVREDIIFWMARLSKGGLLCGHDFSCSDVSRAVTELVPSPEPITGTDIWFTYV